MDWETKYYEETGKDAASDKWDRGFGGYRPEYNNGYVEWLEGILDNSNPPKSESGDSQNVNQQLKADICEWKFIEDSGVFHTDCGHNVEDEHIWKQAVFCQYCSRKRSAV